MTSATGKSRNLAEKEQAAALVRTYIKHTPIHADDGDDQYWLLDLIHYACCIPAGDRRGHCRCVENKKLVWSACYDDPCDCNPWGDTHGEWLARVFTAMAVLVRDLE